MKPVKHSRDNVQSEARFHQFADMVAISFPDTGQLYLTPAMARAVARQLSDYAKTIELGKHKSTSNIMHVTTHKRPITVDDMTAQSIRGDKE